MTNTMKYLAVVVVLACSCLGPAQGFCYRKNPPRTQDNAEQLQQPANYSIWVCVQSTDLQADLEKAPSQITQVWFSMSKVEKLKAGAFAKFAEKLVKIEIYGSKLAEIEDTAFTGLKELKGLILPRNELTVLKAAWFKDTPKLLELNLANNRIQSLEPDFLKLVPGLINLDLRGNEIVTLPVDFVKKLPVSLRRLNLYNNPLNYKQTMEVIDWSKNKDDDKNKLKDLKHVVFVTKACMADKVIAVNDAAVDKCVEDKLNAELAALNNPVP
ncbi:insulin-like growth factor-binding protein complex acid labile subunit [Copidosoma floridanum]|uniref:insulin-like growth factor-binding protein complex acid labile subunit n=1 Tax=Copidosoma floridanum TaxID=29053 RepID=UPI0006C9C7B9|nr:insulin-like growth factor-binding protein complex acid labile subunit [Copidosoma floridanum]